MTMLLVAVLTVVVSAPPLSPEEALRVLRSSRSDRDRTDARSVEIPDRPRVVVIRSTPGAGPFGPLRLRPLPPSNPTLVIPLPRGWRRAKFTAKEVS